ncbi:hypothetical protein MsAm2_13470 [Methanolapillus ohkumae]|uniref:HTH arsR-type domain-containing protein n=2 Tax=Methanolapillus ohkumae TaxID=3028298 RepID=A0AA96ZW31_9EURY|nr:hypothetical protein MsAm2_13470 [Methanosarcinaceae archaeon Am2]
MNSTEERNGAQKPKSKDPIVADAPDGESFEEFDASNVIIIPVNDDSKKIRQILSNETSMKILETLKKESMSSSELAEKLGLPLTTVKYNLDILVENGLANVKKIKYSEKGRQVKIYEAPEKVIVFAPEKISRISIISMLQKYAFSFACAVFAGLGLGYISKMHRSGVENATNAKIANDSGLYYDTVSQNRLMEEASQMATTVMESPAPSSVPSAMVPESVSIAGAGSTYPNIPYGGEIDTSFISEIHNLHPAALMSPAPMDPTALLNESTYTYVSENMSVATQTAVQTVADVGNSTDIHGGLASLSTWIYDTIGYQAFWFILGALFVCVIIWLAEYVSVSRNRHQDGNQG